MNLQNGYKVLYEKVADNKRAFLASKSSFFADAEQIGEAIEIGKYKLIYEKNGKIYCSESSTPTESDSCLDTFDKLFIVESEDASEEDVDDTVERAPEVEPEEGDQVIEGVTGDSVIEEELPE